jgi:hypothetical protein
MKRPDGEILICDLRACTPPDAFSSNPESGGWLAQDYELTDGTKGCMVTADPLKGAKDLSVKLKARGIYNIFIGSNYFKQCYNPSPYGSLWIKLSGDEGFSRIGHEGYDRNQKQSEGLKPKAMTHHAHLNTIYEVYWRTAELSGGEEITFGLPRAPYNSPYFMELANLSFIRLEPADEEDIQAMRDFASTSRTGNIAQIWCAGALTGHTDGQQMFHPTDEDFFINEFESYKNNDIGLFIMECMRGDLCLFKTQTGDTGNWDKSWNPDWKDPLAEFCELAKRNSVKIFAGLRLMGYGRPNAFAPVNWGSYAASHPECCKRVRDGSIAPNLSLAFEGGRRHWLDLLREALEYDVDGVHVHMNRARPFVLFEEPVQRSYKEMFGEDMLLADEKLDKEKIVKAGSVFVTQFVREVGQLARSFGKQSSIIVEKFSEFHPGKPNEHGIDLEAIVGGAFVDYLFMDRGTAPEYFGYLKELAKGRVKIYGSLMPRQQPGEQFAALAEEMYSLGADGFCVWDGERRIQRSSEWSALKHVGHRDKLDYIKKKWPGYYRFNTIAKTRGYDVTYAYKDG